MPLKDKDNYAKAFNKAAKPVDPQVAVKIRTASPTKSVVLNPAANKKMPC